MRGGIKPSILPRISQYQYEPLGGAQSRWRGYLTWRRVTLAAVLLLVLFFLASPRQDTDLVPPNTDPGYSYGEDVDSEFFPNPPSEDDIPPVPGKQNDNDNDNDHDNDNKATLSFETDPDPSKTSQCTKPYGDKPLVQWALMIDAGSTGSRIHVYKFNNCKSSPVYEYEVFEMTRPGLSKFADDPHGAAKSLDVLLDVAMKTVPEKLRRCTPIAVKATAGLRLLAGQQGDAILAAVRGRLDTQYPFKLVEKDGVVIMDGRDEGVYAWITANYLLDTIRATSTGSPYAVLDLGGASTQIVFEPIFEDNKMALEDGEHKYDLDFSGKSHVLYQHSYLGYGLMRARASVHRLVEFMASIKEDVSAEATISNPCIGQGMQRRIEVEIGRGNDSLKRNYTMEGADVGSFDACNRIIELVMAKDAICHVKPCSFNGVYQPSLLDTFPNGPVLLLSYFYDRIHPLMPNKSVLKVEEIAKLAQRVCGGKQAWAELWADDEEAMKELRDRPEYCLDLTFQYALLRLGYEFDADRTVRIEKKIDDTELGWCLGATITMLDGHLECRA